MSGNRRSEDAGEVPWPALVDLLTSVLITFMFFILVTVVAMSTMTIKTAQDAAEKREKSQQPQDTSPTDIISASTPAGVTMLSSTVPVSSALLPPPPSTVNSEDAISEDETRRLRSENEILKQQLAAMGATFAKSQEIRTVPETADNALTLLFNPNEAGMTPEAETQILQYLTGIRQRFGSNAAIEITASEPSGVSFSQARERALTRAMVVRNALLENQLDPSLVSFRYASEVRHKSDNWVRLQVKETRP